MTITTQLKMNFTFYILPRLRLNFQLHESVQSADCPPKPVPTICIIPKGNTKISRCETRSPKYTELGHYTLLFCSGGQKQTSKDL